MQVYVFLLITWIYGNDFPNIGYVTALPAFILTGLMLGSIGLLISSQIKQMENFASVMNFIIFPMFFASSALKLLWKVREKSELVYWVCVYNPFNYAVELVRFALYAQFDLLSLRRGGGHDDRDVYPLRARLRPRRGMLARRGGPAD